MPFDISEEAKTNMDQISMQPTPAPPSQPTKMADLNEDEYDIENSMLNPPDTIKVNKADN